MGDLCGEINRIISKITDAGIVEYVIKKARTRFIHIKLSDTISKIACGELTKIWIARQECENLKSLYHMCKASETHMVTCMSVARHIMLYVSAYGYIWRCENAKGDEFTHKLQIVHDGKVTLNDGSIIKVKINHAEEYNANSSMVYYDEICIKSTIDGKRMIIVEDMLLFLAKYIPEE